STVNPASCTAAASREIASGVTCSHSSAEISGGCGRPLRMLSTLRPLQRAERHDAKELAFPHHCDRMLRQVRGRRELRRCDRGPCPTVEASSCCLLAHRLHVTRG